MSILWTTRGSTLRPPRNQVVVRSKSKIRSFDTETSYAKRTEVEGRPAGASGEGVSRSALTDLLAGADPVPHLVATIEDPPVVQKILAHLADSARSRLSARARPRRDRSCAPSVVVGL